MYELRHCLVAYRAFCRRSKGIAALYSGVRVIDISNPSAPVSLLNFWPC